MIKKIKGKIRTFFDEICLRLTGCITVEYLPSEMRELKRRNNLEHLSDEKAAQIIWDELMQDRRSSPRNQNSYEKGQCDGR